MLPDILNWSQNKRSKMHKNLVYTPEIQTLKS